MPPAPRVSVIIATYNRSDVLRHAIESVRHSTLDDWELIVVGDYCTDDTATVVASFNDSRISFVNLPANCGEQSAPNNEGIRRARGRYLAFLNHDDMYFPDHLASSVEFIEASAADLIWSPLLVPLPMDDTAPAHDSWRFRLSGVPVDDEYHPQVFVFASSWVLKQELARRIGPWRAARETFVTSSQDWLFRAWRAGARVRFRPDISVLALPAGARKGSYASRSREHEYWAAEMRANARFREMALTAAAIAGEREVNRFRFGRSWLQAIRGMLFRPVNAVSIRSGVHPHAMYFALRHGRRGNRIRYVRRYSGLKPIPSREPGSKTTT